MTTSAGQRDGRSRSPVTIPVAAVHVALVTIAVVLGSSGEPGGLDPWAPFVLGLLYGSPGLLVLVGGHRRAVALGAGFQSVALGLVPFSVHSFVLVPAALVYLHDARAARRHAPALLDLATALVAAVLAVAALFTAAGGHDAVCYTRFQDGSIAVGTSFPGGSDPGGRGRATGGGCVSNTVTPSEAAPTLLLVLAAQAAPIAVAHAPRLRARTRGAAV